MLRTSRRCIVSFPNFGYRKLTRMLSEQGRAPQSAGLLRYKWYDSPNIRFFTIQDFDEFCRERGITVHERIALDTESGRRIREDANRRADMAIFVISRRTRLVCSVPVRASLKSFQVDQSVSNGNARRPSMRSRMFSWVVVR